MSYKCLHDDLEASDKHAALSDFSCRIWMLALAKSDCRGRLLACADWLAGHLGFKAFDPARVEASLQELARVTLIHFYESGGKQYLVFHRARRSCAYTGQGKASPRYPTPPASLCECCGESFQQSDVSASGCAISSHLPSLAVGVAVRDGGVGETNVAPPQVESNGSPGAPEAMQAPVPFSANRVAVHLAQRWRSVNGPSSVALSGFEKATHAFGITLAAGADAHAIEAAIAANPGRSPLEIRDIVLPRVARSRASPQQESVEESTRRMEALLNNPEALRRATT